MLYINNNGNVYTIDSSKRVEGTGIIAKKEAYNSLLDGEYIHCNKRIDGVKKNLYASFDIYYMNGEKLTSLPLIDDKKKCRYNEMLKMVDLLNAKNSSTEFMVKTHYYKNDIYDDCKEILTNHRKFPYEIDGLIFTPAKLAVYSYYPSMPVEIKTDMTWNSVFKWKPPEQNTIDFLVRFIGDVKKDGFKYRKFGLYIADKNMLNDYNIKNVLNESWQGTENEFVKNQALDQGLTIGDRITIVKDPYRKHLGTQDELLNKYMLYYDDIVKVLKSDEIATIIKIKLKDFTTLNLMERIIKSSVDIMKHVISLSNKGLGVEEKKTSWNANKHEF